MPRDIAVIGTSAGGVQALQNLVRQFPVDLPVAIFIVLHSSPLYKSVLPEILSRAGKIPVAHAVDGQPIEAGRIYVAPVNRHLTLEPNRMRVLFGPRENLFRPAIDPLFRSAARAFGPRVTGIILSGSLCDGCAGLAEIARSGGLTIVQDPKEAQFPELPENALMSDNVRRVLSLAEISAVIQAEAVDHSQNEQERRKGVEMHENRLKAITCPDCSGPIRETSGDPPNYECVIGHSYSPETMQLEHGKKIENGVWSAIATFEEHATLLRELAAYAEKKKDHNRRAELEAKARKQQEYASELRAFLTRVNPPVFD